MKRASILIFILLLTLPVTVYARNYDNSIMNAKKASPSILSGKLSGTTYTRDLKDDGVSRYYLTPGPSLPPFSASRSGIKNQYRAGSYLTKELPNKASEGPTNPKISAVRTFNGFQGKLTPSAGFSSRRYVR